MSGYNQNQSSRVAWLVFSGILHSVALAAIIYLATENSNKELVNIETDLIGSDGQQDAQAPLVDPNLEGAETVAVAPVQAPIEKPAPRLMTPIKSTAKAEPKRQTELPAKAASVEKQLLNHAPETFTRDLAPIQTEDEQEAVETPVAVSQPVEKTEDPAVKKDEAAAEEFEAKLAEEPKSAAEKQVEEVAPALESKAAATAPAPEAKAAEDSKAVEAALAGKALPAGAEVKEAAQFSASPGNPMPRYPEPDRIAGTQGQTVIVGMVKRDGSVGDIYLEKSSGSKSLDRASLETFRKWKFQSGQQGFVRKPFEYRLSGNANATHGGRLRK